MDKAELCAALSGLLETAPEKREPIILSAVPFKIGSLAVVESSIEHTLTDTLPTNLKDLAISSYRANSLLEKIAGQYKNQRVMGITLPQTVDVSLLPSTDMPMANVILGIKLSSNVAGHKNKLLHLPYTYSINPEHTHNGSLHPQIRRTLGKIAIETKPKNDVHTQPSAGLGVNDRTILNRLIVSGRLGTV